MNESTFLEALMQALKYFWALMDFAIIGIVLLSGYFAGRYLNQPFITKHLGTAWRTLIVSAVFTVLYVIFLKKDGGSFEYTKLFVSYVTATSLYELIIKGIANYIPSRLKSNNMEHWVFQPKLSSPQDNIQVMGYNAVASALANLSQGNFYVETIGGDDYLCAKTTAFSTPVQATITPVGSQQSHIAVPIKRPR